MFKMQFISKLWWNQTRTDQLAKWKILFFKRFIPRQKVYSIIEMPIGKGLWSYTNFEESEKSNNPIVQCNNTMFNIMINDKYSQNGGITVQKG